MWLLLSYTDDPAIGYAEVGGTERIQSWLHMSNKIIGLSLPALHPGQARIIQESKRFNAVCCGRRFGKTVLGMDRVIHAALTGKPVAWFSPTNKFLADTWRELQSTLAPVILEKNEQEKRLVLMGGGVMELWSLDSPDSGRGRKNMAARRSR